MFVSVTPFFLLVYRIRTIGSWHENIRYKAGQKVRRTRRFPKDRHLGPLRGSSFPVSAVDQTSEPARVKPKILSQHISWLISVPAPLSSLTKLSTNTNSLLVSMPIVLAGQSRTRRFHRAMHFSAKRGIEIAYCLSVCLSVRDVEVP